MAFFALPDAAIGPIAAAVVGAVIGFVGLVIAKESKTSEFRQKWIDDLREEISEYIANLITIRGLVEASYKSREHFASSAKADFAAANQASTSIRLRMNPDEAACTSILKIMDELDGLMHESPVNENKCIELEQKLVKESQSLLKSEWARVKVGEPAFVHAKRAGLVAAAFLAMLLIASYIDRPGAQSAGPAAPVVSIPPSSLPLASKPMPSVSSDPGAPLSSKTSK